MVMRWTPSKISAVGKIWEVFPVLRRNYVKLQSVATPKHNFEKLVFNPAKQKLIIFVDEFQWSA